MRALVFALFTLASAPAGAHGIGTTAPGQIWRAWQIDPLPSVLLALAALLYGRGLLRLWRRAGFGRGVGAGPATSFLLGCLVLAAALVSPLEAFAAALLSAHMAQHVLLVAVAPALLLAGRPDAVLAFALPPGARLALLGSEGARWVLGGLRRLARPMPAALLNGAAIWVWHAPAPFQAALQNSFLHDLEHASFFLTAVLFWQSLFAALRSPALLLPAILATVATLIHGGFLAALITLTPRPLYPAYSGSEALGLSALQDQQLAGLIMWVPAGGIYLLAGLILAARLIGSEESIRPAAE